MVLDLETEDGPLEHHHHQVPWTIVIPVYTAFRPVAYHLVPHRDRGHVALPERDNLYLYHYYPYR